MVKLILTLSAAYDEIVFMDETSLFSAPSQKTQGYGRTVVETHRQTDERMVGWWVGRTTDEWTD